MSQNAEFYANEFFSLNPVNISLHFLLGYDF